MRRHVLVLGLLLGLAVAPTVSHALRQRAVGGSPQRVDAALGAAAASEHPSSSEQPAADHDIDAAARSGRDRQPDAADAAVFTHRSARLEDVARTPVSVRIAALGVDAPVVAVGTASNGQLDVPPDGATVVWYRAGSVPGAAGSAVLAAHVDHAGRPGAFYALDRLEPGDAVHVGLDDGSTLEFVVDERTRYNKRVLPIDELFTRNGDAVLTLITCGGQFNHTTQQYDSNTVVQASLE